ncbi:MAG TPA: TIM barrel protein [Rhizobacter sp.]|nr:TIM barrel protein [Rhizobacter sp.]
MRVLSLAALTVLELSPVEMVRCAAQAGYTHVGLRALPATAQEPQWPLVGETPLRREVQAALRDTGVQVLDVEILRLKPETDVLAFDPVLETAAALGASFLLAAGNDPDEARLTQRLAALAQRARAHGLRVCIEPMPWTEVRDFAQGLRVVQATGNDDIGVLVDPLHFDRGGNHAEQLLSVPPQRLPYLQFCDAPAERPASLDGLLQQARGARLIPGEGGLDLLGLLSAAPAGAPLSLEVPMDVQADARTRAALLRQETVKWLQRHALAG